MNTETKNKNFIGRLFIFRKLDENGAGTDFETSYAKTDTPVKTFATHFPKTLVAGLIKRIHYRLHPTNAVTYTLRLYSGAYADDYASDLLGLVYESPPLQADDTDYDRAELDIPFRLGTQGTLYFALEWTGAPGVTAGFIRCEGEITE